MARNYGRFTTSIYRDPDFRALTFEQQGVYFMLGLQAEVSAAGTLPLRLRRWAQLAEGATVESVRAVLDVLSEIGHVVFDEDTEELLIVKFVKWDGGYQNSKRMPVVVDAALDIESPKLRAVLASELDRLGLSDTASTLRSNSPSDGLLDALSDSQSPSDRDVVTEVPQIPQPPDRNPQPATLAPVESTTAQTLVGEWIDACAVRPPDRVIGPVSKFIREMLAEGIDPTHIRDGITRWREKGLNPSSLPSVVNEVMNAPPRIAARQRETDDLFARAAQRMGVT